MDTTRLGAGGTTTRRTARGLLGVAAAVLALAGAGCGGVPPDPGGLATPVELPAGGQADPAGSGAKPPAARIDAYCRLVAADRPTEAGDDYWAERRDVEHRALFLAPTTELREAAEVVAAHTRDVVVPALDGRDGPGAVLAAAALGEPRDVSAARQLIGEWESSHCTS